MEISGSSCTYTYYGIASTSAGAPINAERYHSLEADAVGYDYSSVSSFHIVSVAPATATNYTYYFVARNSDADVLTCNMLPGQMIGLFVPDSD